MVGDTLSGMDPGRPPADAALLRAHLALGVVQVVFGLFPVFSKLAFGEDGFAPFAVGAWRMAFGAAVLCGLALWIHGRMFFAAAREWPRLLVASVLGVSANMLLYLEGLSRSSANEATLIMCLIPVFTFSAAALSGQERFQPARALGVGLALFGASALLWAQRPEIASAHALGNGLMVLNALSFAIYFVWSRPLVQRHPPLVVIAWVFLFSLPAAAWAASRVELAPAAAGARAWAALALILVFATVLTYLLNMYALARLRASTTAVYIYAQPFVTVLAAAAILSEAPTRGVLLGALLVFAGIWLVARRPPPAKPAAMIHGDSARP
jgi:drug/metabolite transporter (DMT)-like permease